MDSLQRLKEQVDLYKLHRKSYSKDQLQDIRDEICLCLFELAEPLADSRFNYERAEFLCKLEKAKVEESLRGGVKMSREQLINNARIQTEAFDEEVLSQHREYQLLRGIIESANNIVNSIASRLNKI